MSTTERVEHPKSASQEEMIRNDEAAKAAKKAAFDAAVQAEVAKQLASMVESVPMLKALHAGDVKALLPKPPEPAPSMKKWPLQVFIPTTRKTITIEKEDALICRCGNHPHIRLEGVDGKKYVVPNGAITTRKLFPNWDRLREPRHFMAFKGDLSKIEGRLEVVVPGYSASA